MFDKFKLRVVPRNKLRFDLYCLWQHMKYYSMLLVNVRL